MEDDAEVGLEEVEEKEEGGDDEDSHLVQPLPLVEIAEEEADEHYHTNDRKSNPNEPT